MSQNNSNKKKKPKPPQDQCPYCGEKNVDRVYVKHAGTIRICKNCREEF
jgi:transcription elongation factor Elf1